MRAIVVEELGGPEVLRVREVAEPEPGPGEVAVQVAWAGVNFVEIKMRGSGYLASAPPFTPGLEVSGTVKAVGAGVTGLAVGQRVTALTLVGGYAETAVVSAALTFPVPEGVGLRLAATLPTVLPTAHALVHEVGRLRAGEAVLVQSAAGGVGTVVGQIAKRAGAGAVYAVVSRPDKVDYVRRQGYDEVFVGDGWADQARKATAGRGVDLLLDPVGGRTWHQGLELLSPFGRAVSFGNASGEQPWTSGFDTLAPGGYGVYGFSLYGLAETAPDALRRLADRALWLAADGTVELPISHELPLHEAAQAHRLIESRTTTGKLVLRVGGQR
ncbi:zinc-binding alcohol dehydrogenase family protein [Streptantibioticus rubrisoli]|uniref:Zinc-binding dehydrogenase n=1 Tax=Streptantibioticus rubrisoli TaxID=1387313 RepID=A0ABT1P8Q7_9ACTN|nr:zinc-binding dehydrogenase [Streptantibioticus rubrisoli]MCQ4040740.1 zinc-binding dehydrogenase [Streptantibioticus rubrisoli]